MKRKLRVGIIGCGAIGTSLAKAITKDFVNTIELAAVTDIDSSKAVNLAKIIKKSSSLVAMSLESVLDKSDLVIEAADVKSCLGIIRKALSKGKDIIVMSVGGVLNHKQQIMNMAYKNGARVYIPSGAICGIDALKSVSLKGIKSITLITRKNPDSFRGVEYIRQKKISLDKIEKDTVLFSGNASQAIKYFPQNINVAATLSIAGRGSEKTKVKIIASPGIKRNIHELCIQSEACIISVRVENIVHPDNPKTSFMAVLSAIATLKQIIEPLVIGT